MGTFRVEIEIGDAQAEAWETISALVDTGSTYTWVPRDTLAHLGIVPKFKLEFVTADDRVIERDGSEAPARLQGQIRTTMVVFSDPGSTPLLGMVTLEQFGLGVDSVNRRLIPVRGFAM